MIPEVEGTGPWGPPRKRVPKCLKGPKTTYTTIAIAEKQSKRSKKGPFSLYIGSPLVPPRKWNLWGPEGKVPPGPPPRFLRPWACAATIGNSTSGSTATATATSTGTGTGRTRLLLSPQRCNIQRKRHCGTGPNRAEWYAAFSQNGLCTLLGRQWQCDCTVATIRS